MVRCEQRWISTDYTKQLPTEQSPIRESLMWPGTLLIFQVPKVTEWVRPSFSMLRRELLASLVQKTLQICTVLEL